MTDKPIRQPLDFQELQVVSDPVSRLAVRIAKAIGDDGRARYRYGIGTLGQVGTPNEQKFFRDISLHLQTHHRLVSAVSGADSVILADLIRQAEEVVRLDAQARLDEEDLSRSPRERARRGG